MQTDSYTGVNLMGVQENCHHPKVVDGKCKRCGKTGLRDTEMLQILHDAEKHKGKKQP